MELTVTQENFARALTSVGRVASTKTQLPILSNILLRTDGNRLLVAATNLEIATTQYIGAKIAKPGAITVPARLISEFVSSLPKGSIELKIVGENIHLTSGKYHSIINGVIADDFPELPTINEENSVTYSINTEEFKQAVSQTIITTSSDSTRPVLTGVYWHSHDGVVYLAATDGYRLSERRLVETTSEIAAIIPTQTLQEVLRTITDNIDTIDILFDESQVRFRINDAEIISRLVDGNFPDYRQLIPEKSDITAIMDKSEFTRVTKISGLFARESGGSITLTIDEDAKSVSLHSIASEYGENTSELDAEVTGSGQVTLNSRYLTEALGAVDADTISFSFSGKLSPIIIKSTKKDTNYYHVIMPLKS
ncbi:MAG: DNA polymerase III subunit beta [Candidatus Saccharimonadaceae bacterium]